jgi:arylsulfatase A-like enzyme
VLNAPNGVPTQVRSLDLENDTLIVFVRDNGGPTKSTTSGNAPLNGFKAHVWEGGIRVPFLVQWKGRIPAGKVIDQPVFQLDIHPTVLAAVGVRVPDDAKLDGVNLLPFLTGDNAGTPHEELFWRFGAQRTVRTGDWKLTDLGEGPKLFNLSQDIGEKDDLGTKYPEKLKELEADYQAWNAGNIEARWKPAPRRAEATAKTNTQQ